MLKDIFRRITTQAQSPSGPSVAKPAQSSSSVPNSPGARFMSATTGEKVEHVAGYVTAMNSVTNSLEVMRDTFLKARSTGAMTDEQIGCLIPEYFSQMMRLWSFRAVNVAELTAHVHTIYSDDENSGIPIWGALEIARDLHLKRITDGQARGKLDELRSHGRTTYRHL